MNLPSIANDVLIAVAAERSSQDRKWGEQDHDPMMWLTILTEEVGEAAKDALDSQYGPGYAGSCLRCYEEEMIQVAAVAIAAVENVRRARSGGTKWYARFADVGNVSG